MDHCLKIFFTIHAAMSTQTPSQQHSLCHFWPNMCKKIARESHDGASMRDVRKTKALITRPRLGYIECNKAMCMIYWDGCAHNPSDCIWTMFSLQGGKNAVCAKSVVGGSNFIEICSNLFILQSRHSDWIVKLLTLFSSHLVWIPWVCEIDAFLQ